MTYAKTKIQLFIVKPPLLQVVNTKCKVEANNHIFPVESKSQTGTYSYLFVKFVKKEFSLSQYFLPFLYG
jgi:hypothetical protein